MCEGQAPAPARSSRSFNQISMPGSSGQPKGEGNVSSPQQRQPLITVGAAGFVCAPCGFEKHALVGQTHVQLGIELDGLGATALQTASPVGAMPGDAMPEHLDEQVDIREIV